MDRHSTREVRFNQISRAIWIGFGVAVGLAIGSWVGSATSGCAGAKSCSVSWEAVSAIGTWIGGIGTVLAVLVAVRAFFHEQVIKEREAYLAQSEREKAAWQARVDASKVTVKLSPAIWEFDEVSYFVLEILNECPTAAIAGVVVRAPWLGERRIDMIPLAGSWSETFRHRAKIDQDKHVERCRELLDGSELRFTMNGITWKRSGLGQVEEA